MPSNAGLVGLLGPGPTGRLHAKSAFSAKQKTLGVGFQLLTPPAKAVPTEPEAAQTLRDPMGSLCRGGELGKRCDPKPRRIGAEVSSPSTVCLGRIQLLEVRLVPIGR